MQTQRTSTSRHDTADFGYERWQPWIFRYSRSLWRVTKASLWRLKDLGDSVCSLRLGNLYLDTWKIHSQTLSLNLAYSPNSKLSTNATNIKSFKFQKSFLCHWRQWFHIVRAHSTSAKPYEIKLDGRSVPPSHQRCHGVFQQLLGGVTTR